MAITRVQGNARATGTGTTLVVTQASAPTNGNLNILVFSSYVANDAKYVERTISSISQTGVTWTKQISQTVLWTIDTVRNIINSEIWVGVVGAGASATITLSLLGTGDTDNAEVANVCEYSGLLTSGFLDKTASTSGTSTTPATGTTATTTQADELWIGDTSSEVAQSTPTNGFTLLDGAVFAGHTLSSAYLEKIASATGTANSGTTMATSKRWSGCIATFKAAVAPAVATFIENIAIRESMVRVATYKKTLPENVTVRDSFARLAAVSRSLVEQLSALKEVLTRNVNYSRNLTEYPRVADSFTRTTRAYRTFAENLSALQDVFSRRVNSFRSYVESIPVQDIFRRRVSSARTFLETTIILDVFRRVINYVRTRSNTVLIKDVLTRITGTSRRLTEDLSSIRDVFARRARYTRAYVENMPLKDVFSKRISYARQFLERLDVQDIYSRTAVYFRKIVETALIQDVFSRRLQYTRRNVEVVYVQAKITVQKTVKAIRKWLAFLARRLKLKLDHTKNAEFNL